MGKIIVFYNHKGGVGKTTLVHNLSFALADAGKKVLAIDSVYFAWLVFKWLSERGFV